MTDRIRYRMYDGKRYRVVMNEGFEGFVVRWTATCTGCYESEDGHPVGEYDFDQKSGCAIGSGCEECGYTGKSRRAEWCPFDYAAYSKHSDEQWAKKVREDRERATA